jgi:rubredoxin
MTVFGKAVMVRLKVIMAVLGAVLFLFPLLALAQNWDSRPWDEPVSCPKCKSDRVVYILYGEPKLDEDLKRALDSGKVELGGCLVTSDSKRWECRNCKYSWGNVIPEAGSPP